MQSRVAMPRPGSLFVAACALILLIFAGSAANAADTKEPAVTRNDPSTDFSLDLSGFVIGGAMTPPPTFSSFHTPDSLHYPGLDGVSSTASRDAESSNGAGGVDLHVGVHANGRPFGLDVPIFGFRYVWLGHSTTALSDAAGDHATLDISTTSGEISVGGIGAHAQFGPLLLRAAIRPVLEWGAGSGTVTQGFVSSDVSAYASFAVGIDADLQACGMVDPMIGVCATASPRMWRTIDGEGGANNGVFFGVGIVFWPPAHW